MLAFISIAYSYIAEESFMQSLHSIDTWSPRHWYTSKPFCIFGSKRVEVVDNGKHFYKNVHLFFLSILDRAKCMVLKYGQLKMVSKDGWKPKAKCIQKCSVDSRFMIMHTPCCNTKTAPAHKSAWTKTVCARATARHVLQVYNGIAFAKDFPLTMSLFVQDRI